MRNCVGVSPVNLRNEALKCCGIEKPASNKMLVIAWSLSNSATYAARRRCVSNSL